METLTLRPQGRLAVGFTIHPRSDDPARRATRGAVVGTVVGGAPKAESWVSFRLFAERRSARDRLERVRIEPSTALLPGHGASLRACAPHALAVLHATLLCDPQDREDLTDDDPEHLMAFLDLTSYEATVRVLGYYALGFGADYPFRAEDPERSLVAEMVRAVGRT